MLSLQQRQQTITENDEEYEESLPPLKSATSHNGEHVLVNISIDKKAAPSECPEDLGLFRSRLDMLEADHIALRQEANNPHQMGIIEYETSPKDGGVAAHRGLMPINRATASSSSGPTKLGGGTFAASLKHVSQRLQPVNPQYEVMY
jgi:hypothetical protein